MPPLPQRAGHEQKNTMPDGRELRFGIFDGRDTRDCRRDNTAAAISLIFRRALFSLLLGQIFRAPFYAAAEVPSITHRAAIYLSPKMLIAFRS